MSTKSKILIFDAEVDIQGQKLQYHKNVILSQDLRERLIVHPKDGDWLSPLVIMRVIQTNFLGRFIRFSGFIPVDYTVNEEGKIYCNTWAPGSITVLAPSEDEKE